MEVLTIWIEEGCGVSLHGRGRPVRAGDRTVGRCGGRSGHRRACGTVGWGRGRRDTLSTHHTTPDPRSTPHHLARTATRRTVGNVTPLIILCSNKLIEFFDKTLPYLYLLDPR